MTKFLRLLLDTDTLGVRVVLALLGLQWAIALSFPNLNLIRPNTYSPAWQNQIVGYAWILVDAGLIWRVFARIPRPILATAINLSCLALIATWVISSLEAGYYPVPAATYLIAAFWMAIRSGAGTSLR